MAKTLEVPLTLDRNPVNFDEDTMNKLHAINALRMGAFGQAFDNIGVARPDGLPSMYVHIDDDIHDDWNRLSFTNRREWKLHMATLIGMLAAEGQ